MPATLQGKRGVGLLIKILTAFFTGLCTAAVVPAPKAIENLATWAGMLHLVELANYLNAAIVTGTTGISNLASWAVQFGLPGLTRYLTHAIDTATALISALFVVSFIVGWMLRKDGPALHRHGF
jgi:hypothetical protein